MDIPLKTLKGTKISMKDAKNVEDTQQLDGEAKDSPVWNEDNETVQYKTPGLPGGDEGGRNNLGG